MEETEVLEQPSAEDEVTEDVISEGVEPSDEAKTEAEPEPRVVEEPPVEPPKEEVPITETEEFKQFRLKADKRASELEERAAKAELEKEWVEAKSFAEQKRNEAQQAADNGQIPQEQANHIKSQFSEENLRRHREQWYAKENARVQESKSLEQAKQEHDGYLRYNNAFKVATKYREYGVEFNDILMDESLQSEEQMTIKAQDIALKKLKGETREAQASTEEYPVPAQTNAGSSDDDTFEIEYSEGKHRNPAGEQKMRKILKNKYEIE